MSNQPRNTTSEGVFSRSFYEKISVFLFGPFYFFFLALIYLGLIPLTRQPLPRTIALTSFPLLLISLYFTSRKKVLPQRMSDCLQILVWLLILAAGNTYWGGPMGLNGPLFLGTVVFIPLFALLLDTFLPYFVVGVVGTLATVEFLLTTPEFSVLLVIEFFMKLLILLIVGAISSALIQRILAERKATQQLQAAYEDLKRLDRAKSEFISIASHQLRTPLAVIKGFISMVAGGTYGQIPRKAKKRMEDVYQSNERLIKLVDDLLSVSRIEAGKMELKPKRVSLEDIISSIVNELKPEAEEKALYLKWQKPKKPLPKISVDEDKVRQALFNVIDNAIRYTEEGGVTIELTSHNSSLLTKVSDTGVGLTKKELTYLFESFSRGKAGAQFWPEGIGLGLYITRRFLEMHNGKIWAESKGKGKGSTFFIELPVKRD